MKLHAITLLAWALCAWSQAARAAEEVPLPFALDTDFTPAARSFAADMGGLHLMWKEDRDATDWPTSRMFRFSWRGLNWDIWNWLGVKTGKSGDRLWQARLRSVGRVRHDTCALMDAFWEYPRHDARKTLGLIHARFMRRTADGFLFCRLDVPDPPDRPLTVRLTARPNQYWPKSVAYENLVLTPEGRHVVYRQVPGEVRTENWEEPDASRCSPVVLSRGLLLSHSGAGLIYLPEEVASIRSAGNPHSIEIELTLKPETESVRLCLFEYTGEKAESALKKLSADQEEARAVLRRADWQTTAPRQIVDADALRESFDELFEIAFRPAGGPDVEAEMAQEKQRDSIRAKLSELQAFVKEHAQIEDAETLSQLYRMKDYLTAMELELQERFLKRIADGELPRPAPRAGVGGR